MAVISVGRRTTFSPTALPFTTTTTATTLSWSATHSLSVPIATSSCSGALVHDCRRVVAACGKPAEAPVAQCGDSVGRRGWGWE